MTVPPVPGPPEGHPDDLLSAHLDDELDPATDAWVVGHLDECETCRSSAEALRETRRMLGSLPAIDARPVVDGVLARHRRWVRLGAGFVGVAACVFAALALTAAVEHPRVLPDIDALTAAHLGAAHAEMDGVRAVDDAGGRYAAPPGMIGNSVRLSRHAVYDGPDLTVVLYRDDPVVVSVYEQPGSLDWDALPDGELRFVGTRRVWLDRGAPTVAVTELGDLVVTVVSEHRGAALTALAGLPERHRSSRWDRVHDACQRVTRVFALGG